LPIVIIAIGGNASELCCTLQAAELPVTVINPRQRATEEEIFGFCREHLAKYKVPRSIHFLELLPHTVSQKVQKRELKKIVLANLGEKKAEAAPRL
jgi:acyl-CoA synthetase (AMP-forming)/AMP-acid ligase II